MTATASSRLETLLSWAQEKGLWLHPAVEAYLDEQMGFSIRVREGSTALEPGFSVVSCPTDITLSYLNALSDRPAPSSSAPAFPNEFISNNLPAVVGRFFLIRQYLDGKKSPWWPYLHSLPQPEKIAAWTSPPFWPDDDVAYLAGTNACAAIAEIQANLTAEFQSARKQLQVLDYPGWQDFSQVLYNWAFAMFSSRAFRPSLILPEAAQQTLAKSLPPGVHLDDFSILQPVTDLVNHIPTASVSWRVGEKECTLVSNNATDPGIQIFQNYGPKTNVELFLSYGFTIPVTKSLHNDYLHFQKKVSQGDEALALGAKGKPLEFLISLRPMDDPSSVAGRARQFLRTGDPSTSLPLLRVFTHMEDFFVLDFALTLMDEEEQQALVDHCRRVKANYQDDVVAPSGGGLQTGFWLLSALLSDPPEPRMVPVLSRIQEALSYKLQCDLETLHEAEGGLELKIEECSENRRVALRYREQVKGVIRAALRSLEEDRNLISSKVDKAVSLG